jgi:hypothetical protein
MPPCNTPSDPCADGQVDGQSPAGSPQAAPHGGSKRGMWGLAIGLAGLLHLGITLFADWTSPLFGMTLIALAGYELFVHHGKRQGHD